MKERKKYIDYAKGLGLFMVMYGHVTPLGNTFDKWGSSFKLSIFFIVSGYLLAHSGKITVTDTKSFIVKSLRSMLIPYCWFSLIAIIYKLFIAYMKGRALKSLFIENLYITLTLRGISALWFLPSLLIGEILFYFVLKNKTTVKVISALTAPFIGYAAYIVLLNLEGSLSGRMYKIFSMPILTVGKGILGFWFVMVGYYGYKLCTRVKDYKIRGSIGIFLFILNIILFRFNNKIDMNNLKLGERPWLFFVCGIIASFGAILMFELIEKYVNLSILGYCGKNSLIIMCTHTILGMRNIAIGGWKQIATLSETVGSRYYFECFMIVIILLLLEYALVDLINKKAPFLIGKKGI